MASKPGIIRSIGMHKDSSMLAARLPETLGRPPFAIDRPPNSSRRLRLPAVIAERTPKLRSGCIEKFLKKLFLSSIRDGKEWLKVFCRLVPQGDVEWKPSWT
jgi:hypothetical protein